MSFKIQGLPLQDSETVRVKQEVYDDHHKHFDKMDSEDLWLTIFGYTMKEDVAQDVYDALSELID